MIQPKQEAYNAIGSETLESTSGNSGVTDHFVKKRKREDVDTEGLKSKKIAVVLELNAEALKECIRQVCRRWPYA